MARGLRGRLRGKWLLVVVGGLCVTALVLESIALNVQSNSPPPGTTGWPSGAEVTVGDVDLIASYQTANLSDTNYLGQQDCGCAPLGVAPGGTFDWWIRVANSDPANHTVLRFSVNAPFALQRTFPSTPIPLSAGANANVTLVIQVPSTGGYYVVTGAVWTA